MSRVVEQRPRDIRRLTGSVTYLGARRTAVAEEDVGGLQPTVAPVSIDVSTSPIPHAACSSRGVLQGSACGRYDTIVSCSWSATLLLAHRSERETWTDPSRSTGHRAWYWASLPWPG